MIYAAIDRTRRFRQHPFVLEALGGLACAAVLVLLLRGPLVLGTSTFGHDVLYWSLPIYHYVADNLRQGQLPYWNPFSHAGEPMYPVLLQLRLLEPVTPVVLWLGRLFTDDLLILFSWDRVTRALVASVGMYVLLRQWTSYMVVRVTLWPILLWSSFVITTFAQPATLDIFTTAPFFAFFALRILHDRDHRWGTWIGLAIALGLAWQSYFFVGSFVLLLVVLSAFAVARRQALTELWRTAGIGRRAAVAGAVVALMALPNAVVLAERDRFVFPARMVDHDYDHRSGAGGPLQYEPGRPVAPERSIVMPYSLVQYSGTAGSIWDFLQLIAPEGSRASRGHHAAPMFGRPGESFMYIGLLAYSTALIGMFGGSHALRRVFLLVLGAFTLLLLGPAGGLHQALYYVFPPLWFQRHTHLFVSFVILALLYFYVIGANRVVDWTHARLFDTSHDVPPARPVRDRIMELARTVVLYLLLGAATLTYSTTLVAQTYPVVGLAIVTAALLGIGLRRRLGPGPLFLAAVLVHALLVLLYSPRPGDFLVRATLFLVVPAALVTLTRYLRPRLMPAMLWVAVAALTGDLLDYAASAAIHWQARPAQHLPGVAATPPPARFVPTRQVTLTAPALPFPGQAVRYLEVASRIPTALSSVVAPRAGEGAPTFDDARRRRRWNSFLLQRSYFELIHSRARSEALEDLLAVNRSLLQLRTHATILPLDRYFTVLGDRTLPTHGSRAADLMAIDQVLVLHEPGAVLTDAGDDTVREPRLVVEVEHYDYNSLSVRVDASASGFLYYADGYDAWWRAMVDGRPVPVMRANGNFKAIPITAGAHHVRFLYDPLPFRLALYCFYVTPLAAVAALGGSWVIARVRRRPPTSIAPPETDLGVKNAPEHA